jgi:hypothetical protein
VALALVLAMLAGAAGPGAGSGAAAQGGAGEVTPQSDGSVPARGAIMIGASPGEAPAETWGVGEVGHEEWAIVRYAEGAGWSRASWLEANGHTPSGSFFKPLKSPLTGEMTANGAGALIGNVTSESQAAGRQVLLVRTPGGAFQETEAIPAGLLKSNESLFERSRAPLLAALDEGGGKAGALVVAVNSSHSEAVEDGVLHWDGSKWTREQIEVPEASKEDFRVLAMAASSPANAWLLAVVSQASKPGAVVLFRRVAGPGGTSTWRPVNEAEPLSVDGEPFTVSGIGEPPTVTTQVLTVTNAGVWLDGERGQAHLTMFFKPDTPAATSGKVQASWCKAPGAKPCGENGGKVENTLPDELPSGPSRSVAWEDPSTPFGDRVISGLSEGVSLRLEGKSFQRVLALGGGEGSTNVGGVFGAAFSNPREGWLGATSLPVHLTEHPSRSELAQYPVPFHHALLAVAPQPGAPVGALTSQALAVGNRGEVARYIPGEGWQPESLLGAGGRRATPLLRAVAWPTPARAFAVGVQMPGQVSPVMWLWRGETGLWESDPAEPRNFRANLLGVAFDPNDPSRGYAVGQGGVLLRYGKSWTQDALPPEAEGASFTSIAFAGRVALVAFRKPEMRAGVGTYTGGLLVNEGSGWAVDTKVAAALGPGGLPWAVAGLPDGAAALSGEDVFGTPLVLERNSAGDSWHPTPPYPGLAAPGSLALFREGGALRAVGAGSIVSTSQDDFGEAPPPPGFPPNLIHPYAARNGYILRQTANGWSDQQGDLNEARPTTGEWANYDLPVRSDPSAAVLLDPAGGLGWAVGGEIDPTGRLDTAEVARYHENGARAPGFAASPVGIKDPEEDKEPPEGSEVLALAVGGGAQCAAPCADRANAGVGPDVWLKSAIKSADEIGGLRAFIYTGPRVTTGEHLTGNNPIKPPYEHEFERYAGLISSPLSTPLPTLVAPSATDRAAAAGECPFRQAFEAVGLPGFTPGCSSETRTYYEVPLTRVEHPAGRPEHTTVVRVIVLDDANGVDETQLGWLNEELDKARKAGQPAIAVGNGDLNAEMSAGTPGAVQAAGLLAKEVGGASAYFYDSPGHNVALSLRVGTNSIPAFGSGTLGYANALQAERQDFTGHSGFLLAEVDVKERNLTTNRAPVGTPRLIPNIGELALEAKDGVLLRRSQPALFAALARRPRAGCVTNGTRNACESSQYIPIPANCVGSACETAILPEYKFSSSRADVGDFVQPNPAAVLRDPHAVLLGPNDKPIPDAASGLFCAYNPGTTVATISAGGLSASLAITVQAGSVRRPCGTQPSKEGAAQQQAAAPAPPAPAPAPAPAGPAPAGTPPLVPVPPAPVLAPPPVRVTPSPPLPPYFPQAALGAPLLPFVPPPVPTPARPTPPSGTSAVTSPIEVAEREEEQEEAPESVSNQAVAYRAAEHEPSPAYVLGVVILAALAGASIRRRPRRNRGEVRVAPATLNTIRAQRRADGRRSRVTRW